MRFLLIFFILFCGYTAADPLATYSLEEASVRKLASALDPNVKNFSLLEYTQAHWLRPREQERWELAELDPISREIVLSWAQSHDLYTTIRPTQKHYDVAIIFGASKGAMHRRLMYLNELWSQGIHFKKVVFLTSARPVDQSIETDIESCKTEADVAQFLWKKSSLASELSALEVSFICAPMNDSKRPQTKDTLLLWLHTQAQACSALFISNQPFCGYQFAVAQRLLPSSIDFEVAGPSFNPDAHPAPAALTLDTIARQVYEMSY